MMKNWKRWITCGLAAILTLGCVACGRTTDEERRGGYEGVEEDYAEGITVSKNEKEIYKDFSHLFKYN